MQNHSSREEVSSRNSMDIPSFFQCVYRLRPAIRALCYIATKSFFGFRVLLIWESLIHLTLGAIEEGVLYHPAPYNSRKDFFSKDHRPMY